MARQWTEQQLEAIEKTDSSVLVSAAAGSGKTTVMIERVARLLTREENPVPIKRFLIISFTKASASDMKNKLIKKLSSLKPTKFILEQLDDILTSDVSNLHSFCARLLKSYFYEVGLDPTFVVLDDEQAQLIKDKAIEKLFSQKSENTDAKFFELVDIFSAKRSLEPLKKVVFKIYDFLCSIVNRKQWKDATLNGLYNDDLSKNRGAQVINAHLVAEKYRCKKLIEQKIAWLNEAGEQKLVAYLQALESIIDQIHEKSDFLSNAKRIAETPRMPNIPKGNEKNQFLVDDVKAFKEGMMKRFSKLKEYALCDDLDNLVENLKKTRSVVENLFNLTDEFENLFKSMKKDKGGLDFNDLEQYTLEVTNNKELLEEIKGKYDYILVDEYQDINGVQEEIISRLSSRDNRFMVGDVKQSIYRFRLCDPEIFLNKYNLYSQTDEGALVLLNANFRSKSSILDFVNEIFSRTMTLDFGGVDYEKDAKLVAGRQEQIDDKPRVHIMFANCKSAEKKLTGDEVYSVEKDQESELSLEKQGQAEGIMIAHEISRLVDRAKIVDSTTGKERLVRFGDITILTQSRTAGLAQIIKTLEEQGIKVSSDVEDDCFEDEYVYGIKSFLDLVGNYKNDYSLFSCLYSRIFDFTAQELAKIRTLSGEGYFYKSVRDCLSMNLDKSLKDKLTEFFAIFDEARARAKYVPVREIAKDVLRKKDVLIKLSYEQLGEQRRQKMNKFLSTLGDENIYEYLLSSSMGEVKCEPSQSRGAVKVMTIHKSKGLEFGVVFVVMANKGFNFKSINAETIISKDLGFAMNYYDTTARFKVPTLAKQAVKLTETRKLLEEQQRLLYVALTRATDYLYVVGSGNLESVKPNFPASPTCFMDFIGNLVAEPEKHEKLNYTLITADGDELIKNLTKPEKHQVLLSDKKDMEEIRKIFEKKYPYKSTAIPLKTAVTSLINEGETSVLYDDYDGAVSSAKNGTINHKFMEKLSLLENREQIVKRAEELVNAGYFTSEEKDCLMIDGIEKLIKNQQFNGLISGADKIFKEREFYLLADAKKYFDGQEGDGVVVQGIVDLCIFKDGKITIVDYKTGSLSARNLEKYKKQLSLYGQAMEKSFDMPVEKRFVASLLDGQLIEV